MNGGQRRWLGGAITLGIATAVLALALRDVGDALIVRVDVPVPDVIVSLASHEWERLPVAARLALETPKAVVLLTEPVTPNYYNCFNCGSRVASLIEAGVERSRIVILDRKVDRTYDEAIAVRHWAMQHGARAVTVVTSPYHTRRALMTFRHVLRGSGIDVGVRPARETSPADPNDWWRHEYDREYVAYESSAALYYLLRFGVKL